MSLTFLTDAVLLLSESPSRHVLWPHPLPALRVLPSTLEAGPVITPQVNEWPSLGCMITFPTNDLSWGCLSEDILGENYRFP